MIRTLLLSALCWVGTAIAAAAQPLLEQDLPLGKPSRTRTVTLVAEADGKGVSLHVGKRTLNLPWEGITSARAEAVEVAPDTTVLRLLVQTATGESQALVGGPGANRLLWQGSVGLEGDPGEREGQEVAVLPGSEGSRVVVRRRHEALTLCSGAPLWLETREVDPSTLGLRRVTEPELPAAGATLEARAAEGLTAPSELRMLRPSGASDPDGVGSLLPPPRLDDGDRATAVVARGKAPWLFLRAHLATGGFPVRRVELAAPAGGRLPETLRMELGKDRVVRVTLDPKAPVQAFDLPEPSAPGCLSLIATGPFGRATGVGELRAVTDLHTEDPATPLAEGLVKDAPEGAAAARMLARLGAPGARAALAVWPRLTSLGRRRALPVLAPYLGEAAVLEAVTAAAADPALTEAAVEVLASSEGPGRQALASLAASDEPPGPAALHALGATPGNAGALLALLAADGGADRPALRAALGEQSRVDPAGLEPAAAAWLPQAPAPARAALALSVAGRHPRLSPLAEEACQSAAFVEGTDFVERYRCALAFAKLPAGPVGDTWLKEQAGAAQEWMQRREAVAALAARESPAVHEVATAALADDTPRVRQAAATALAKAGPTAELRARAVGDPWPAVRQAAVQALADDAEAAPLLRGRVADPSRNVRAAAITALTAQGDAEAWPAVKERMAREREFPAVRAAAVRYAGALCVQASEELLMAQLARGLGPDAEATDVALSVDALRALRRLGGSAREKAEAWLEAQGAPTALGRAAGEPPPCLSETGAKSPTG